MHQTAELNALIASFKHPQQALLETARKAILQADPLILEGIKWNSLSFKTTEWFATWNWRAKDRIEFVLHLGAKVKTDVQLPETLLDSPLIQWKSPDRGIISFADSTDFEENREHFRSITQEWIKHVG